MKKQKIFNNDKLQNIIDKINSRKILSCFEELTKEELLTRDINGITFLEHIINSNVFNSYSSRYDKDLDIAYIYYKLGESLYVFNLSEEDLFKKVDGNRFIDLLAKKDKITSRTLNQITTRTDIIDILIDNGLTYLIDYISDGIINKLFTKDENGKYYIEKYFDNTKIVRRVVKRIEDPELIINAFSKKEELLSLVDDKVLLNKINDKLFLEYLMDKNIVPEILYKGSNDIKLANYLRSKGMYEYLTKFKKDVLLSKIENGKYLIEELLDMGYKSFPNVYALNEPVIKRLYSKGYLELIGEKMFPDGLLIKVENDKFLIDVLLEKNIKFDTVITNLLVAKKLVEYGRSDLLVKCDFIILLQKANPNKSYFEYLLEEVKSKRVKCNLNDIYLEKNIDYMVSFYMTLAKYDMIKYVDKLNEDDLLKKYSGTSLLEALLAFNEKITIEKIIPEKVKSNLKIGSILLSRGLTQSVNVPVIKEEYTKEYLEDKKSVLGIGPLYQDGEESLFELNQLFMNDGFSDHELVSSLVSGYRAALFVNYDSIIKELKNLINVKKNNYKTFGYKKVDKGGYFSMSSGSVYIDRPVVSTLMHETGHALHYYLTDNKIPKEYYEAIERANQNPELLKKVDYFYDKYRRTKGKIKANINDRIKNYFDSYYTEEKRNEIKEFLETSKEEKYIELKKLGISEDSLNIILTMSFTEEEYERCQKNIFEEEYYEALFRTRYGNEMAVSDILDAIFYGYLYSGEFKNDKGKIIEGASGHGISYYSLEENGFAEMIANFSLLVKSPTSITALEGLKSLIGEELYNILSGFYYENIANIKEDKSLGGLK